MNKTLDRRAWMQTAGALAASAAVPAVSAQERIRLLFSEALTENDVRAKLLNERFGPAVAPDFDFKPHYGATLFRQGTELVAMQRGNLDMGALAVSDIQRQIPEWGIVGAPYVFRDLAHAQKVFSSDVGKELFQMTEEKIGVKLIAPWYLGTRHVSLRGKKKVMTPVDLGGVKLRMPAGEGWQFIGTALGAIPVAVAYGEVYTALQTGAIDAQDNPMPLTRAGKFYEVLGQYVLTGHLVNFNLLGVRKTLWDTLTPARKDKLTKAMEDVCEAVTAQMVKEETELAAYFRSKGLDVYEPNRKAFRDNALEVVRKSKFVREWKPGMLERINAL
jgi:TRAP-type C4-dicarboxylate transport system substrate-binding protein